MCEGVVRRWLNRIASRGPFYQMPCKEAAASLVLTAPTPSMSYRELAFPVSFLDEHLKNPKMPVCLSVMFCYYLEARIFRPSGQAIEPHGH